jgi:hypothetical protein
MPVIFKGLINMGKLACVSQTFSTKHEFRFFLPRSFCSTTRLNASGRDLTYCYNISSWFRIPEQVRTPTLNDDSNHVFP